MAMFFVGALFSDFTDLRKFFGEIEEYIEVHLQISD